MHFNGRSDSAPTRNYGFLLGALRANAPGVLALLLLAALIAAKSWAAVAVVVFESPTALVLLAAAAGWGLWPARRLRIHYAGAAWLTLSATALGTGLLAAAGLALGAAGLMHRGLWWAIAIIGVAVGAAQLPRIVRDSPRRDANPDPPRPTARHWLLLLVVPFAAVALLAAVTPPGVLWGEEGFGYDELEYHLGVPREWMQQGRISYLPHNVYSNFPFNAEMMFLWAMVLRGDPWAGVYAAKLLNVLFAAVAVAAAWRSGRDLQPRAGLPAAVLLAGQGWIAYVSGLAYVESAMMFFAALSLGAALRAARRDDGAHRPRWSLFAGLTAGLACGCKYTALGLVALPVGATIVLGTAGHRRIFRAAVFALGMVTAFSPWLVKNAVLTGDPLFPLGRPILSAAPAGWDAAAARHFRACHMPQGADATLIGRLARLSSRVLVEPHQRIGTWLFALAAVGALVARREPATRALLLVLVLQTLIWLFATHLYARFAIPLLLPLALLAAQAIAAVRSTAARAPLLAVAAIGLAVNACLIVRLYVRHLYPAGMTLSVEGATWVFTDGHWPGQQHLAAINTLPPGALLLMIGDARGYYMRPACEPWVVFNRNPFVAQIEAGATAQDLLDWLRNRGYSHLFVHWGEIARLRASQYGFPPAVDRDLLARLRSAGLRRVAEFTLPGAPPYAELFEVPGP